jgi:hypothetical protein
MKKVLVKIFYYLNNLNQYTKFFSFLKQNKHKSSTKKNL